MELLQIRKCCSADFDGTSSDMGCIGKISSPFDVDRPSHISELLKVVELVPMEKCSNGNGRNRSEIEHFAKSGSELARSLLDLEQN